MVQDLKIIILIQCDTRWYKFLMNYSAKIEKVMSIVLIFYLLVRDLEGSGVCHSSLCLLVSGSYMKIEFLSLLVPH
jgi:hypothetical protein